jgi:hypothetical protein
LKQNLRRNKTLRIATAPIAIAALAVAIGPATGLADEGGSSCPPLPLVEENAGIIAHFPGKKHKTTRTLFYGHRTTISGRLIDPGGFGLPGEPLCIEERPRIPHWPYSVVGTTTTRADGSWSMKLPSGPSRSIRVNYGGDPELLSTFLNLGVRAHATLHLHSHRTRPHRRVYFSGRIPGPQPGKRVVILRGTVPGAKRKYLVRRGRTDAFGRFRIGYAFSPVAARTKFVFWIVVPAQDGYPYRLGRSSKRFIRVRP